VYAADDNLLEGMIHPMKKNNKAYLLVTSKVVGLEVRAEKSRYGMSVPVL
jgi:hypothetical protein